MPLTSDATAVMTDGTCSPMTPEQTERAELAIKVLQSFPRHDAIFNGAMAVFANPRDLGEEQHHCVPESVKARVSEAVLTANAWSYGLPGLTRLNLARELGPRDPLIVADVGNAAFSRGPLTDIGFADLRPYARSVLAGFGSAAAPWRERALAEMHPRDSMGTSAAQVAAASGQPAAVAAVAQLLRAELAAQRSGTIKRLPAKRLVELAYALASAGSAAREHVPLLVNLLNRDVESFAPPFGVIERTPNEVCRALERIGGLEARAALRSARCIEQPWFLVPG